MTNLALYAESDNEEDFPDIETYHAARPMGEVLVTQRIITADQLRIALTEQKNRHTLLGATLVTLGFINEETLALALAERAGVASVNLKTYRLDDVLARRLPQSIAQDCLVLPLKLTGQNLIIAMADPYDITALDAVRRYFPRDITIQPRVASRKDLCAAIQDLYGRGPTVDEILREFEEQKPVQKNSTTEHPVVRLVDALLADAAARGASDVHLEPESGFVRVRIRLDGALRQIHAFHLSLWPVLSHRLKIMAGMNIADTRSIQDGRFQMNPHGHDIDCRVAIMPSVWGETIVIRLLDHRRALLPLESLGYSAQALERLKTIAAKPHGITLVTGPTGSGKTTTLYSLLQKLSTPDIHIATLEDPIEYQMELVRQTAIQDDQGLGFAEGVRGLLRMDPDIILIGEIRDSETAQMALRAAMTGHQVYATLHCNDALGALPRLIDLGLSRSLIAGNFSGIIAQRLVRKLCPACKKETGMTAEQSLMLGLDPDAEYNIAASCGCEVCNHTGRKGRTVVAEVLPLTAPLDDLISRDRPRPELWAVAQREGLTTLRKDGIEKLLSGVIGFDDLRRSIDLTRGDGT